MFKERIMQKDIPQVIYPKELKIKKRVHNNGKAIMNRNNNADRYA
jgi:hypothetical protein